MQRVFSQKRDVALEFFYNLLFIPYYFTPTMKILLPPLPHNDFAPRFKSEGM